jgi:hypothetical protein
MQRDLGIQDVPKQAALAVIERDAGFIAGGLDAEHQHGSEINQALTKLW